MRVSMSRCSAIETGRRLRNDIPASGTAVTFAVAQAAERDLGLDDYTGRAPKVTGQSTQVFSGSGVERVDSLDFDVSYDGVRGVGVDTRLKVDDRLAEFSPGEAVSSSRRSPPTLSTRWPPRMT